MDAVHHQLQVKFFRIISQNRNDFRIHIFHFCRLCIENEIKTISYMKNIHILLDNFLLGQINWLGINGRNILPYFN